MNRLIQTDEQAEELHTILAWANLLGLLIKIDKRLHPEDYKNADKLGCPLTISEPTIQPYIIEKT